MSIEDEGLEAPGRPFEPVYEYDSEGRVIRMTCLSAFHAEHSWKTTIYDDCEPSAVANLPFASEGLTYTHVTLSTLDGQLLAECRLAGEEVTEQDLESGDRHPSADGQMHAVRWATLPEEWPPVLVVRWFDGENLLEIQTVGA